MKKKMPSEGLRLGRDSGSILCDTLKKWRFRTGWGGGIGFAVTSSFIYRYRAFRRCQTMASAEGFVRLRDNHFNTKQI